MKRLCVVVLLLLVSVPQVWGWGRYGHQVVARIAEARLTPSTAAQVKDLLGTETLIDVAPWADAYRADHRETGPWHYVDIPSSQQSYDRERDCPAAAGGGEWRDCAVDRIPYFVARLKDRSLSQSDRAFALKMVVHLVGDLHQPFHAIGDAHGGNGIHVSYFGSTQCGEHYTCNLHGIWDEQLLERRHMDQKDFTAALEKTIAQKHWDEVSQANPVVWANEAHKLGVSFMVSDGAVIGQDYYDSASPAVDRQLAVAGIRLARILNAALGE